MSYFSLLRNFYHPFASTKLFLQSFEENEKQSAHQWLIDPNSVPSLNHLNFSMHVRVLEF